MTNGNENGSRDHVEEQLLEVTRGFEQLITACPPALRPRQRILRQQRGGFLFIEVLTSFKILKPEGERL
jgi:hypothetical protein